jgi:FtsZ-interacting cell division protein ZipA
MHAAFGVDMTISSRGKCHTRSAPRARGRVLKRGAGRLSSAGGGCVRVKGVSGVVGILLRAFSCLRLISSFRFDDCQSKFGSASSSETRLSHRTTIVHRHRSHRIHTQTHTAHSATHTTPTPRNKIADTTRQKYLFRNWKQIPPQNQQKHSPRTSTRPTTHNTYRASLPSHLQLATRCKHTHTHTHTRALSTTPREHNTKHSTPASQHTPNRHQPATPLDVFTDATPHAPRRARPCGWPGSSGAATARDGTR